MTTYIFTTLDNAGGPDYNQLVGINDAGEIVGYFSNNGIPTAYALPIPYPPLGIPAYVNLAPTLAGSLSATEATGINNVGTIVGVEITGSSTVGVYGFPTPAGTTPATVGSNTQLRGVNDAGVSVGWSVSSASATVSSVVVYDGKTEDTVTEAAIKHSLGTSVTSATATGINDTGVIVGAETIGSGSSAAIRGFVYEPAVGAASASVLAVTIAGATLTDVLGINNEGQIVGEFQDSIGIHGFVGSVGINSSGAATVGGYQTIDYTNAVATMVDGINDQGQIVGSYVGSDQVTHGFVGDSGTFATITNPVNGAVIALPYGSPGVEVHGSAAVGIVDSGVANASLFGNAGNDTIAVTGAAATVTAGDGNNVVYAGPGAAGSEIFLGVGNNTVRASAAVTISGGQGVGTIVTMAGGGVLFAGSGQAVSVSGGVVGAASTVIGGSGRLNVNLEAGGGLVFAGSGNATVQGGFAAATLVGGSGAAELGVGPGGGLIFGGAGADTYSGYGNASASGAAALMVVGTGASTVYAFANDTVFLNGSSNVLVADEQTGSGAASGNETLVATGSSGTDTFQLENGHDVVYAGGGATAIDLAGGASASSTIVGGSGVDTYVFTSVQGGHGSYTIYDFRPGTDIISLNGFGQSEAKNDLANASFAKGNTKLSLNDSTTITFVGVHLTANSFG